MWPKELIDALDFAVRDVELVEGYTKAEALVQFLDTAAAMAVWRCKADPASLESAYFWPYTPIGHLTNTGFDGTMQCYSLHGAEWGEALGILKAFLRVHGAEVCRRFADKAIPYPHQI